MSSVSDQILKFNPSPSTVLHVDINSCFATIEQQANPLLRGRPIAVAAYDSPGGCILAASIEAKQYGIKTGMRVKDGRLLYPKLIVLPPDANKYRYVHLQLKNLLSYYTDRLSPKSIDEFVLHLDGYPILRKMSMFDVAMEIKQRIRDEIGDWIRVSIGIAPSRYLAKTAASIKKPDGLEEINSENYYEVYQGMKLTDLTGIAYHNEKRLHHAGIFTVTDLYNAPIWQLRAAFRSVVANDWYLRLRGWEIDDVEFNRRSYGNSYALPQPFEEIKDLAPILSKLVNKMSFRLRKAGYRARGIRLSIYYRDRTGWNHGHLQKKWLFDPRDFYAEALRILHLSPRKPVRILAVSCFDLTQNTQVQTELFDNVVLKKNITEAMDKINLKWGDFTVTPANMATAKEKYVHDRIAFGGVKELTERG